MQDTLVAINVIYNNELVNPKQVPLLYYNNGDKTILESLREDNDFKNFICKLLTNKINAYNKTNIAYFFFDNIDDKEEYKDNVISLQDFMSIEELTKDNNIWGEFVKPYFNYLYKCAYKNDYNFTKDIAVDINNIYNKIQEKYPNKIIKNTVVNYIRSELVKSDNINEKNIDWIVSKLNNILENYE